MVILNGGKCFVGASAERGMITRNTWFKKKSIQKLQKTSLIYFFQVRLLIGVGRYSEMSYIIDALREHDQFEQLLGRGSDPRGRETGLDRALLHYLRSKYPEDTETMRLVALHFLLYSEVYYHCSK